MSSASASSSALLNGLDDLIGMWTPFEKGGCPVEVTAEALATILARLRLLRHLAFLNERELGAFRLLEAGRFATGTMEDVATTEAGALVLDPEGKVIRPDFGGRS